jgi:hypothetical protein
MSDVPILALHAMQHADQVKIIGEHAERGLRCAVICAGQQAANRLITDILEQFPGVECTRRIEDVPEPGVVTLRFAAKPTRGVH